MPPPESKDAKIISRDLQNLTTAVKQLTRAIEKQKPSVVNNYMLPKGPEPVEIGKLRADVHLALMEPNDPRPSCWGVSGIGRQFTITNFPEDVTCDRCRAKLESDPLYNP